MTRNIPAALFRYTWLNPKYPESSFENIFKKNEIYSSLIKELNDPFDCLPQLNLTEISNGEIKNELIKAYDREKVDPQIRDAQIRFFEVVGLKQHLTYRYFLHVIPTFKNNRVFCLSETPTEYSMWVYYAHYFQGFCLEIKPDDSWKSPILVPIEYKEQPCVFDLKQLTNPNFDTVPFVTIKSNHWSHEKEWRIFNHNSNNAEYIPLPGSGIACIYLGMGMSKEHKDKISNWVKESGKSIPIKLQKVNQKNEIYFE